MIGLIATPSARGQSGKACCKMSRSVSTIEVMMESWKESCQACGAGNGPLTKLSLGKDFFGRPYDRLSPSSDQSPKWYCAPCSMHKNLQRDFRDICAEFDKLRAGHISELAKGGEFRRASLRLQEILTLLSATQRQSPFLSGYDVTLLMERLNTLTMPV
jgi:hypothetical protein